MTHTPGPWTVTHRCFGAKPTDDEIVGLGWELEGPPEPMLRGQFSKAADAYLVAAAPDLLEALQQLIDEIEEGHCVGKAAIKKAIAALAKARGTA